jgi:hypothetical protein
MLSAMVPIGGRGPEARPWFRAAPAALSALVLAVYLHVSPAHGQRRFDAADVHACTSAALLIDDLRHRTVPTSVARERLATIYDLARTSSTPALRHIADAHRGELASANDTMLLVMAEQFRAACR